MDDAVPTPRRWKEHLPAVLILGSPAAAAGMMLSVALTNIYLLPEWDAVTVAVALIVRINVLLGPIGAAAGALRVGGTTSTPVAVLIASAGFAAAAYFATILLAIELLPGFDERYGP